MIRLFAGLTVAAGITEYAWYTIGQYELMVFVGIVWLCGLFMTIRTL